MSNVYTFSKSSDGFKNGFVSEGRKEIIEKAVSFDEIDDNFYNLTLLDFISDEWTVENNSNNGNLFRILRTLIAIIEDFTSHFQEVYIYFKGTSKSRTSLYHITLASHLNNNEFKFQGQKSELSPFHDFNINEIYTGF